jgi:hypothetical protein
MPTVVVPVGLNLGPSFRYATPPDPVPEYFEVRLGQDSEELDEDEYRVWGAAFVDGERHSRLEVDRASLEAYVRENLSRPADPGPVVDALLARGLLVEFDPEGALEEPFRRLRLHPLAEGLGNTSEEPAWRGIGHGGQPVVRVNGTVYGLWAYSSTEPSLWQSCRALAEDSTRARVEGEDVEEIPVEEAARAIAGNIPMLVAAGCAYLEPVST